MPLALRLTLVNTNGNCASLAGYAVYVWHCDVLGRYSMYDSGVTNQNYLRGVQVTDAGGVASFTTVFPGCYAGRWPRIQLALTQAASAAVYATAGYTGSTANLGRLTLASDSVFSDGSTAQVAAITGDTHAGYTATLQVGISA